MGDHEHVKLWLDDVRTPPDDSWTWVRTVTEAIAAFDSAPVEEVSLDHDLGLDASGAELPAGRVLVLWMAEHDRWPSHTITVHSANPVGVEHMVGIIERYGPFERVGRTTRFIRRRAGASSDPRR